MPLAENTQVEEIAIRNKNSYSNSYKIVVGIYRPDKKESETKLTSDVNLGSSLTKLQRDALADALRGSGDKADVPLQVRWHRCCCFKIDTQLKSKFEISSELVL